MKLLKILWSKQLKKTPKWMALVFVIVSAVGFLDTNYLTAKHYLGSPVSCVIFQGCEQVTTSRFSTVGGVPVALLGAFYYLTILLLSLIHLDTKRDSVFHFAALLTPAGFLASIWFIYLQLAVIKALCLYCIISATTSTVLFILGMVIICKQRQVINPTPPEIPLSESAQINGGE